VSVLPRLIATDLDGTLLDANGDLSERSAAALRAAAAAGITVVIASGRPPQVVQLLREQLGASVSYGVLANGTIICTLPDATILKFVGFPTSLAVDAVRRLRDHDPGYGFALATDRGMTHEPGFLERMPVHHAAPVSDDVLTGHDGSEQTMKLLVFHHERGAVELLDTIPAVLGGDLAVTHMGAEAVEVGPVGLDKGAGLAWLCDHLDIDAADVLVFGDEINDLSMFAFAGRAVAVANASEPVLLAADEIAPANTADGVAVVIERLLAG
jgi:Cof subfamily protein (haloacid dehalogenase superfamily)